MKKSFAWIILLLVAFGAGGFTYYQFYTFQKELTANLAKNTNTTYSKSTKPVEKPSVYFYVNELGVRFEQNDELKKQGVTSLWKYDKDLKSEVVFLSSIAWAKLDESCSPSKNGAGTVLALSKGKGIFKPGEEAGVSLVKQFDGFYIASSGAQSYCSEKTQVKNEWSSVMKAFNDAIKSMELI